MRVHMWVKAASIWSGAWEARRECSYPCLARSAASLVLFSSSLQCNLPFLCGVVLTQGRSRAQGLGGEGVLQSEQRALLPLCCDPAPPKSQGSSFCPARGSGSAAEAAADGEAAPVLEALL